jgi:REP element-mobilizing transposase RayT
VDSEFSIRKPLRINQFNYSFAGYYFVTLCVNKRIKCLGQIINSKMILNKYGEIVNKCWTELPDHYSYCKLDEYTIMPDHLHGIILIENPQNNNCNLSTIIKGFKSFSSKQINLLITRSNKFCWQISFYDRIIRNENELFQIRKYIEENPLKWEIEKGKIENLNIPL